MLQIAEKLAEPMAHVIAKELSLCLERDLVFATNDQRHGLAKCRHMILGLVHICLPFKTERGQFLAQNTQRPIHQEAGGIPRPVRYQLTPSDTDE